MSHKKPSQTRWLCAELLSLTMSQMMMHALCLPTWLQPELANLDKPAQFSIAQKSKFPSQTREHILQTTQAKRIYMKERFKIYFIACVRIGFAQDWSDLILCKYFIDALELNHERWQIGYCHLAWFRWFPLQIVELTDRCRKKKDTSYLK